MDTKHFFFGIIVTLFLAILMSGIGAYFWNKSQIFSMQLELLECQEKNIDLASGLSQLKEKMLVESKGDELLSLNPVNPLCTGEPVTKESDAGGPYTVYPVAEEYIFESFDTQNIGALFTAAACGDERLNTLFDSYSWNEIALYTVQPPNRNLLQYLKSNGFTCEPKTVWKERYDAEAPDQKSKYPAEEAVPDDECTTWYAKGPVTLKTMIGLRKWAAQFIRSDCRDCG